MAFVLACLAAWALGGIPFGLVLVRLIKGVDIRTLGSGNVGATNASRAFAGGLRLPVFFLIYLLDFAKGFVPAFFGPGLVDGPPAAATLLGSAAIIGHCASPFLGFKGGKGVATATGVAAALDIQALLVALATFGVALAVFRQVWIGSLALGIALATALILHGGEAAWGERLDVTVFGIAVATFLFYTHRSNIRGALQARAQPTDAS